MHADDLLPGDTPLRLIDEEGSGHQHEHYPFPSAEVLRTGYGHLVLGRRLNDQADALVRQGRLAVYPSSHGQEACEVAAAMVLDEGDWLFPTYRDSVAVVTRGVDPVADVPSDLSRRAAGGDGVQDLVVDEPAHVVPAALFGQRVEFGLQILPAVRGQHRPVGGRRPVERQQRTGPRLRLLAFGVGFTG